MRTSQQNVGASALLTVGLKININNRQAGSLFKDYRKFSESLTSVIFCVLIIISIASGQGVGQGQRFDLTDSLGLGEGQFAQIFVPDYYEAPADGEFTLIFHFHSATWAAEDIVYRAGKNAVLFNIHLGAFSSPYQNYFANSSRFQQILDEILQVLQSHQIIDNPQIERLIITSFSAGYAGVREVLKSAPYYDKIDAILLADGLHATSNASIMEQQMTDFLQYAKDARDREKVMLITHSSIPTPGYESTTSTANYLINGIGADREAYSATDEVGTQYSRCDTGYFHLKGYLGDTAEDHLKHLYGLHLLLEQAWNILTQPTTGVIQSGIIDEFTLFQNYPNPFNPDTRIRYTTPVSGEAILKIYDVSGRQVAEEKQQITNPGQYVFQFDGQWLSSGTYIYQLTTGSFNSSRQMLLVK